MPLIQRYNRQQQPKNRPVVNTARSTLDAVTPLAQEQYNNSLAVNGVPILFFSRLRNGVPCTCTALIPPPSSPAVPGDPYSGSNQMPTEPGQMKMLDPQGFGTDEYIASMLEGSRVSINRYGARPEAYETNDEHNPQRSVPFGPRNRWDSKQLKNSKMNQGAGDIDDPFIDELEPFDASDLTSVDGGGGFGGGTLNSSASTGCGVCMGTGFVGGFALTNGTRLVFDTQYRGWQPNGFMLVGDKHPNVYSAAGPVISGTSLTSPSAQITVLLPKGAVGVDAFRMMNNITQVDGVQFSIWSNGIWVPVDGNNLVDYCDGLYHQLLIVFTTPGENQTADFTHLELQFDMGGQPLYMEFSRLVESENVELPENVDPQNLVITPLIPLVRMRDVIFDTTHERIWILTNVQDFRDRVKNPFGWEAQARLVQKFEIYNNFAPRRILQRHNKFAQPNRYKPRTNNYEPYTDYKQTLER